MKQAIEKFINNIDPEIELTFYNKAGYYVNIDDKIINVDLDTDEGEAYAYERFVKKTFHLEDFDVDMLSLLHEIGHIMTYDVDMVHERDILYFLIDMAMEKNLDFNMYNEAYFNIPAEKLATEWAVGFYRYNREMCDALAKEIKRETY